MIEQMPQLYSVLTRSEPALYHAQRCLDICQEHQIADTIIIQAPPED